jgi:CRP-like cAMP-binding protein
VSEVNERLRAGLFPEDVTALIAKRLAKLAQSGTRTEPKLAEPAAEPAAEAPRAETDSDGIRRKRFSAGAYVFRQGDRGDEAYMVDRGEIAILVGNGKRERIIAVAERGEVFGEMALVDRKPRMASARAKTDSVVIVIPEEEFRARLDRIAEVDRLILGLLTRYVERLRAQSALEPVPG